MLQRLYQSNIAKVQKQNVIIVSEHPRAGYSRTVTTPARILSKIATEAVGMPGAAAEDEPLEPLVLVGETDITEPIVGEGTGSSPPFSANASADRGAKPTEAGLARYTE